MNGCPASIAGQAVVFLNIAIITLSLLQIKIVCIARLVDYFITPFRMLAAKKT